jgi:protein phosphatase
MALLEITQKAVELLREPLHNVTGRLVTLPNDAKTVIIGDIHGDLATLNKILDKWNRENYLIFLGDYIDRGPKQLQVLERLLELYTEFPSKVILQRGNHEGPLDLPVTPHDFPIHLQRRYGSNWRVVNILFNELFNSLFTSTIIEGKALLLHGCIPSQAIALNELAYAHDNHPGSDTLEEILWSDPSLIPGIQHNFRGCGKLIGFNIAERFLDTINVKFLIRGHECFDEGFYWYNNRILSLFSCKLPMYRNKKAAFIMVDFNKVYTQMDLTKHVQKL